MSPNIDDEQLSPVDDSETDDEYVRTADCPIKNCKWVRPSGLHRVVTRTTLLTGSRTAISKVNGNQPLPPLSIEPSTHGGTFQ